MISKSAKSIKESDWQQYVAGYFLCMDITDHGVLQADKTAIIFCKGQDTFTPVGKFFNSSEIKDPHNLDLELTVNNTSRVKGNTGEMLYKIPKILEMCSYYMTLEQGDLILTGTPVPPGHIVAGDTMYGTLKYGDELLDDFHIDVEDIV